MIRVRKYRYFVAVAVLLLVVYSLTRSGDQWDALSAPVSFNPLPKPAAEPASKPKPPTPPAGGVNENARKRPVDAKKPDQAPLRIPDLKAAAGDKVPLNFGHAAATTSRAKAAPVETPKALGHGEDRAQAAPRTTDPPTVPVIRLPDRKTPQDAWKEKERQKAKAALAQGPLGQLKDAASTTTSQIHWSKPPEHFPIAKESIIPLPTGKPKAIPRIQHDFAPEGEAAREKRLQRLGIVKSHMERAWGGYKTYAWMHDELRPVSKTNKDPFCGWAATLVDALDTLWIMGMKAEFEEAVKAVEKIDFTFSEQRDEIPVFETTIRYLGGLLGAYDVSGGKKGGYTVLLDKAVELAEILMGIFDTPNRMPVLYYNWKPSYASKPHRASTSNSIAELGSLLMEFTRLAQITGEDKYFDAVERITDALVDWQNRGTTVPGIFPERVDASGCNQSAAHDAAMKLSAAPVEKVQSPLMLSEDYTGREYGKSSKTPTADDADDMERPLAPSPEDYTGREYTKSPQKPTGEDAASLTDVPQNEAKIGSNSKAGGGASSSSSNLAAGGASSSGSRTGSFRAAERLARRSSTLRDEDEDEDVDDRPLTAKKTSAADVGKANKPLAISEPDIYYEMSVQGTTAGPFPDRLTGDVCYPQGLTSGGYGSESYSMGGSQDSTYEYFPKQFLLLGGLESKYKKLHMDTVEAVKQWLLYRPMVPDNRDILFSAKMTTRGKPEEDAVLEFEVTHLTCFLGGMFGLGGKIFGDEVDVAIASKLADGCVWAYESTASGIMPEGATVAPCASVNDCQWNETLWKEYLDPMGSMREVQIQDWKKQMEELSQAKTDASRRKAEAKAKADADRAAKEERQKLVMQRQKAKEAAPEDDAAGMSSSSARRPATAGALRKREYDADEELETSSNDNVSPSKTGDKKSSLKDNLDFNTAGGVGKVGVPIQAPAAQVPLQSDKDEATLRLPEPERPLSHDEYVQSRIELEKIPPGFVNVNARNYILR